MTYWVYILRTTNDTLYCGIARDVEKRFREHIDGTGKGAKYTRANKPVEIVYKREFETKSEALKEEIRIKNLTRTQKLELCSVDIQLLTKPNASQNYI